MVIAAPLGYEYWSTHRSLRALAEALARAGWNVLRFDWDGTDDSAGDAADPDRVTAWRASLGHAVATARQACTGRIALVGVRMGATLALLDAVGLQVDAVVVCAPVFSGKRFVKELKLLGTVSPEHRGQAMYAGLVVDSNTASGLAGIDLEKDAPPATPPMLVVARSKVEGEKLQTALHGEASRTTVHECPQMRDMLDVPSEDATVPGNFIEPIIAWLGDANPVEHPAAFEIQHDTTMPWRGGQVREAFIQVDDLAAVCSRPVAGRSDTAVVFLNSGSEPHIGPGRAWVEYSRTLALHGYACIRTDFSGWGESPDDNHAPGRPYDAHCVADTLRIVAALRGSYGRIVLAGLCAGAWVALDAARQTCVDGVFALNPQLYWQPGDPVEALMSDTHRRRTPDRRREARGARWKYWSLLDCLGIRPMASRWLMALRKQRTPVALSFAEGDDGLAFLHDRCGRRLARELRSDYLTVEEVPGIDHQMYRLWHRPAVIEQMLRFLEKLPVAKSGGQA